MPYVSAEIFAAEGRLDRLEAFTSAFGAQCYGLPLNGGTVTLARNPWTPVRGSLDRPVPFQTGHQREWQVIERS